MDAILDLTSRAVSLIVLIQDSLIRINSEEFQPNQIKAPKNFLFQDFIRQETKLLNLKYFRENGIKISWISIKPPENESETARYGYQRCLDLIAWINKENNFNIFYQRFSTTQYFPSPEQWREAIREVLYIDKDERILLADALQYLPIQIVLTANSASEMNASKQRFLQIWNVTDTAQLAAILSPNDVLEYDKLKDPRGDLRTKANTNLKDEKSLIEQLEKRKVPLSFLQIFNRELIEVQQSRKSRAKEVNNSDHLFTISERNDTATYQMQSDYDTTNNLKNKNDSFLKIFEHALNEANKQNRCDQSSTSQLSKLEHRPSSKTNYIPDITYDHNYNRDVLQSAKNMDLWALAFSGGGIRSATFNLGVLQGLAKKGLLSKFDYLSTVSGGGYIGSWLVSWIYRKRSVIKVGDRLDPKKSSDPLADEVRPIRWLRMYSNYLTPSTGIMSADSWTVGMTLIRNMLINQLVILSLFLTLIGIGKTVFLTWLKLTEVSVPASKILTPNVTFNIASGLLIMGAALLAGLGMYSYHNERFPRIIISSRLKNILTHLLITIACLSAVAISIWMYRHGTKIKNSPNLNDFKATFCHFSWTMVLAFVALLTIAFFGRYDRCFKYPRPRLFLEFLLALVLSAVAVGSGGVLLTLIGRLAYWLANQSEYGHYVDYYPAKISFIVIPPLVIEVMTVTVVLRMAFMGINFPDDRREWWGRIGGLIHRICLIWIVLFGISMMGIEIINQIPECLKAIKEFFAVGWGATLLLGVKYAFSGTTNGEKSDKLNATGIKEKLALFAPYLFIIALISFMPQLFESIHTMVSSWISNKLDSYHSLLFFTAALALTTFVLARQIGVNQFSMHLFYKNRLVRAFLGATRMRLERQRSANPFTGFDVKDDLPLASMVNEKDYFGPYPLINTTLSAGADTLLDRQDRKAESFIFSPLYSGFDFSRTRASANAVSKSYDYAFRPTNAYGYEGGPHIGTAMAISGAAVNPNMGYHTSPTTAFLLSLFNLRLGWWMGNPRMSKWKKADPEFGLNYLIYDLMGNTNTTRDFVCLSDGAHFDNMGLYELVRRKCRYIILSDAEQDERLLCEGLANAVRRCRIDFGVEITFNNIQDITQITDSHFSSKNYAIGKISYPENQNQEGILIYIKASMTGKESVDIQEYGKKNKTFPHQTTGDQFFNEEQFESYRKLGMDIVDKLIP